MDNFLQRVLERLFPNMLPERRAQKLAMVNTLTGRPKPEKKQNSVPTHSVKALAYDLTNSPVSDSNHSMMGSFTRKDEGEISRRKSTPTGVARSFGSGRAATLRNECGRTRAKAPSGQKEEVKRCHSVPVEVHHSKEESEREDRVGNLVLRRDSADCSHTMLAIPSVSTANLLEEIEAHLPPSYSLASILDHTPHTVSNIRTWERLTRVGINLIQTEEDTKKLEKLESTECDNAKKIRYLQQEAFVQKTLMNQANKIVQLCKVRKKHLDHEDMAGVRVLLLAKLRYDAINLELQNLLSSDGEPTEENLGEISISDIYLTLNNQIPISDEKGYYVCVASHNENLYASHARNDVVRGKLHFPVEFKFENLRRNFCIQLELYRLNCGSKGKRDLKRVVDVKKCMKIVSLITRNGHSRREETDFICVGKASLELDDVRRRQSGKVNLVFHNKPESIFGETVSLNLKAAVSLHSKTDGFLNMFKNCCWHTVWCCRVDYTIQFWINPEDRDKGKAPFESVYLPGCRDVHSVTMDVCIRPHSFVISDEGKEILLSASSNRDMLNWINHIKSLLLYLDAWAPDF